MSNQKIKVVLDEINTEYPRNGVYHSVTPADKRIVISDCNFNDVKVFLRFLPSDTPFSLNQFPVNDKREVEIDIVEGSTDLFFTTDFMDDEAPIGKKAIFSFELLT